MKRNRYVIVCNSQYNSDRICFLVDRNKTKKKWWSFNLRIAMIFNKKSAAKEQVKKLKHNNPRLMTLEYAMFVNNYCNNPETKEVHPLSIEGSGPFGN